MRAFADRLCDAIVNKGTPVMVGLDPRWDCLPDEIAQKAVREHGTTLEAVASAYRDFCRCVIEIVAPIAPIVKFQAAFFEAAGSPGFAALAELIAFARRDGLLVVLDGKRNDIGATAEAYAQAAVGRACVNGESIPVWSADAVTVNPYLGTEGLDPFVAACDHHDAGAFVLVRTSNPGAGRLQDLETNNGPVYQVVADWIEEWSSQRMGDYGFGPVGAVVGATAPQQLTELRRRIGHGLLLIPGYGAQGGTSKDVASAFDSRGLGAVVNSSRGILIAYREPRHSSLSWRDAICNATQDMIDDLARHTPAGAIARRR